MTLKFSRLNSAYHCAKDAIMDQYFPHRMKRQFNYINQGYVLLCIKSSICITIVALVVILFNITSPLGLMESQKESGRQFQGTYTISVN